MIKKIFNILRSKQFYSPDYWEKRYSHGGNSGDGSYGRLSHFKADVINDFLKSNRIHSAIELGSGDGNQLQLVNYIDYTGLDISATAIKKSIDTYQQDSSKKFIVYKPGDSQNLSADVTLSLDVLYHIVERNLYDTYLKDLFSMAEKWVVIYSTDFNQVETQHVIHRKFTDDVITEFPEWKLDKVIKNPYPGMQDQESLADFHFYCKK